MKLITGLSIIALAVGSINVARADIVSVDLALNNCGYGSATYLTNDGNNLHWFTAYAGSPVVDLSNSSDPNFFQGGQYQVFAVENYQWVQRGEVNTYNVMALTDPSNTGLGALTSERALAVQDMFNYAQGQQYENNQLAQAFQVALWEVGNDGLGGSLTTGNFKAQLSNPVAAAYYAELIGSIGTQFYGQYYHVAELTRNTGQSYYISSAGDVSTQRFSESVEPDAVPTPSTMACFATALLMLYATRRMG